MLLVRKGKKRFTSHRYPPKLYLLETVNSLIPYYEGVKQGKRYYKHEKGHRINKPSDFDININQISYYCYSNLHRLQGPASISYNTKLIEMQYHMFGEQNRHYGPERVLYNNKFKCVSYFKNNRLYRYK